MFMGVHEYLVEIKYIWKLRGDTWVYMWYNYNKTGHSKTLGWFCVIYYMMMMMIMIW